MKGFALKYVAKEEVMEYNELRKIKYQKIKLGVAMHKEYIEQREGVYWVAHTRVSLDSIVYAFWDGLSPESIVKECFPVLSLEQVYGAITYYLAHRVEIDEYLKEAKAEFEALRQVSRQADPQFYQRITAARQQTTRS